MPPENTDTKDNSTYPVKLKRRPAWQIVFSALSAGCEVELEDRCYVLDEVGDLCHKAYHYVSLPNKMDPETHEIWFKADFMTMNGFIAMCNRIEETKLIAISMNMTMRKLADEKAERRRASFAEKHKGDSS